MVKDCGRERQPGDSLEREIQRKSLGGSVLAAGGGFDSRERFLQILA
jgi:hypothetical protein